MGAFTSCEKCVGAAAEEKLRRESTSLPASHQGRPQDVEAIAAPVLLMSMDDLLQRLEEVHEEHLQRSKKLLRELRTQKELEAAVSLIDLEVARLEAEKKRQIAWAFSELQMASVATAPVADGGREAKQVEVDIEEVIHPPPGRRASFARPRGLAAFMKRATVRWTLYVCLALALFTPGMVTLLNLPDDPTVMVQDLLFCIIGVAFALEMLALLLIEEPYRYSFFFLMDLLGTISMAFEISFLLGNFFSANTVVLRTARTAKLGARMGRLIKLVKCVSMFNRSGAKSSQVEAKVLASKLVVLLSTRVSVIVIVMVMVVPLSTLPLHPAEDLSLSLWPQQLEESYYQDQMNGTSSVQQTIDRMVQFYQGVGYWPYLVRGMGADQRLRPTPLQGRNSLEAAAKSCRVPRAPCATVLFNFTGPGQLDALVEVCTITFIILLMAVTSCDLQEVVDRNLVKPLEEMLSHVREHAFHIWERLSSKEGLGDSEEEEEPNGSEIKLIQRILQKLSRLASLADVSLKAVTHQELENMNAERKAVLLDMLNVQVVAAPVLNLDKTRSTGVDFEVEWTQSWDLNFLEVPESEIHDYVHYIFFSSQFGQARHFVREEVFVQFGHNVEANYKDVPYHCFPHGVDVLFTVFRLLQLTGAGKWTSRIEQHALLVASLCHDLGHFGRTNQFLVETKHDLALRYNDSSPLENMHCAMLFQLCHAGQDVFADGSPEQQKEARKIAIAVILHTDNIHHFDMVKDVSAVYEMESEICDAQAAASEVVTAAYREKVLLGKNKMMWLQLFLHFADVSNPLKPFALCRSWAWRVLDEFFEQGDEEKSLGVPCGMLNDREKVNRPGSQHGFINFLVAPFVAASVRIFPGLQPMHAEMISNLEEWRELWAQEAKPTAEEVAKKTADVEKLRAIDMELRARAKPMS